jgi:pimeloyl-ACP methyl ester carboxylesterase
VKERPVLFGPTKTLSGILTEPAGGAGRAPAVLLLNAGLLHRVGPNRLSVTLARRLAALGFPVLRFDYSGLGESEPRRAELSLEESMLAEGIDAMNFLQAEGVAETFVSMGLCAGAEQSQRLAHADARVVGGALIDGYAYRTPGYYVREVARHVFSLRSWRRFLVSPLALRKVLAPRQPAASGPAPSNPGGVDFVREFPTRDVCLAQLDTILAREVELFLVFTGGGMAEYYNYPGQFVATFPSLRGHPRIRLDYMPLADHTFTLRSQQDAVVSSIETWAREKILAKAPGATAAPAAAPAPAAAVVGK